MSSAGTTDAGSPNSRPEHLPAPAAGVSRQVQIQYERFPYPPGAWLKIPLLEQSRSLAYATGVRLISADEPTQGWGSGIRILVAGCGTLEPLVVAQQNPDAAEIVAVDLSEPSLATLSKRWRLYRAATLFKRRPTLHTVCADLFEWQGGEFDFILASNVLHHTAEPARLLQRLAAMLRPGGLLRMVTYPRQSRMWMRETAQWFKLKGLGAEIPDLRARAGHAIFELPTVHPIRSAYRTQPEILTRTGLVDAFFHAQENPLSPLEWGAAGAAAGLECIAEAHDPLSRSEFLDGVAPELAALPRFEKLEILDALLELAHNPVLWWVKRGHTMEAPLAPAVVPPLPMDPSPERVTSRVYAELRRGVDRAQAVLTARGIALPVRALVERLRAQVGPRSFPGLTLGEYDWDAIAAVTHQPWDHARWVEWESRAGAAPGSRRGLYGSTPLVGRSMAEQVDWLQALYGPRAARFELRWS